MFLARSLAYAGLAAGGLALLLVLVHFQAGPLAPTPALEDTIADTAAKIRASAARALAGEEAPVATAAWDIDRVLRAVAAALGSAAIILSMTAFALGARLRLAIGGAVLGGAAVAAQFVIWLALALIGALLVWAILENLEGILGS